MFFPRALSGKQILNLDTHILLFALQGQLSQPEESLLRDDEWCIASIVLWEIAKLRQLGRIEVDLSDRKVRECLSRIQIWPLDQKVALTSTNLDFSSDPADELIAATSIVHQIPLLTRDRRILSSKIVPLALRPL